MAECFGGEASVAHRLLQQRPECVPELVGVERRDPKLLGELPAASLMARIILGSGSLGPQVATAPASW